MECKDLIWEMIPENTGRGMGSEMETGRKEKERNSIRVVSLSKLSL